MTSRSYLQHDSVSNAAHHQTGQRNASQSPVDAQRTRAVPISRWTAALRAERITALGTPAARTLLGASSLMAAVSLVANLSVVDDLTVDGDTTLRFAMHASTVATLIFALVAGLYSATTDHRFGLVDQRALSQPRRQTLLGAKALAAATVGLAYAVLGALTAIVAGSAYYATQGASFDATSPIVIRSLLGLAIAAPAFAVIGVAVGTLARNQPIAIGGSLAWMLIVEPTVLLGLPEVGKWLPGGAGLALTYSPDETLLSQPMGLAILTAYAVATMAAATHRFANADL